jgi:hypothetical protein
MTKNPWNTHPSSSHQECSGGLIPYDERHSFRIGNRHVDRGLDDDMYWSPLEKAVMNRELSGKQSYER